MTVAHQGIELKPIPFIDNAPPEGGVVAEAEAATAAPAVTERADRLSEETAARLRMIEKLMSGPMRVAQTVLGLAMLVTGVRNS